ncbi:MAG: glucosamine-6-phosphate deaminase [Bacteroidetes bacterium]|nr:glucosamine-6-phosphate deaminase [Bacteroidota bacterium]
MSSPDSGQPFEGNTAEGSQREKFPVLIFDQPSQLSLQVAKRIASLIEERRAAGKQVVLGLPTGSTPIGVYQHLITMHQKEDLDFSNVVTFNLDEYFPMDPDSLQSYHRFMHENFFDHVNIPKANIHIPRGDIKREEVEEYCLSYEHKIRKAGGLDLLILGIGRSGHIGFNEPGSGIDTRTRLIILDEITKKDAASDFFGDENVPREAITMGVGTILDAREIILMATGEHKAPIIMKAVEEEPTNKITASFLQKHRDTTIYCDEAASGEFTRIKTPWVVRPVQWTEELSVRAVIWLAEKVGKAILRLEEGDFHRHHLHSLAYLHENTDQLCKHVFESLRRRIRYSEDLPKKKEIIVFSPHPDDDVISMGGMLDSLVQNKNDVTVAYMTNGSVAVFDSDVRRYIRFMEMAGELFIDAESVGTLHLKLTSLSRAMTSKPPGNVDSLDVQQIKAFIRYSEAIAGIEVMRLGGEHARFLDMPFYKTGKVRKMPIGETDVQIVLSILEEKMPDHIFVAGDLSDPHGTHRMCYFAIEQALIEFKKRHPDVSNHPMVWLYRGAWQEWEIDRADVFVPMSKADLDRKIEAIFKHESQKDRAMYPGAYDIREFWERARDRNQGTAARLNGLGLPEFHAAEAYVCVKEL